MPTSLAVECQSDPAALVATRETVRQWLGTCDVDSGARDAVDLALEELVGNTIRYGFEEGALHRIAVRIDVRPDTLTVALADDARPFDPTRHPEPPGAASLAEAPVGGLGIAMVRRVVRSWSYRREGGANCLELEIARGAQRG